jgi:hypothetical protein
MNQLTNLEFSGIHEVSGEYNDTQFVFGMYYNGDDVCFKDEHYYTLDGSPRLMQPQKASELQEAVKTYIYETDEFQAMIRDYEILNYDYREHLNEQ